MQPRGFELFGLSQTEIEWRAATIHSIQDPAAVDRASKRQAIELLSSGLRC